MNTTAIQNSVRAEIYRILSECYKEPCIEFAQDLAEGRLYRELEGNLKRLGISISLDGLAISASRVELREGEVLSGIRGGGGWLLPSDRDKTADLLQSLKEIFYPLFVGPSPSLVLPVESAYKEWAREGNTLISSEVRGMLMGDPAIDMIRRYREAGMEIPAIYKDMPDHLALLLEYMALLCEAQTAIDQRADASVGRRLHPASPMEGDGRSSIKEEQAKFIEQHLDWVPELCQLIYTYIEEYRDASSSKFYRTVADITLAFINNEREICLK